MTSIEGTTGAEATEEEGTMTQEEAQVPESEAEAAPESEVLTWDTLRSVESNTEATVLCRKPRQI